jgi:hypothetical protein
MNKMVINHLERLFVTSDASTITQELEVQHPAAKLLVMAAQAQQQEIGDATNLVGAGVGGHRLLDGSLQPPLGSAAGAAAWPDVLILMFWPAAAACAWAACCSFTHRCQHRMFYCPLPGPSAGAVVCG